MRRKDENNVKRRDKQDSKDVSDKSTKKPFDKKTYRLKKYSNKYKVDQWEDRRKKAVLRRYYKDIEKDRKHASTGPRLSTTAVNDANNEPGSSEPRGNAFFEAKKEYRKRKEEKQKRKEEANRRKEETAQALNKYKEAKVMKYKKLSKKTKKGQPVMKDRLEMLLEKIQQSTHSERNSM